MIRLHAGFRERHGLPALPTAWTLADHLNVLRPLSSLVEPGVGVSRRGGIVGGALNAARRVVWEILKPIFYRQSEINRDMLLALEALSRDRETRLAEHHILSARIWELERQAGHGSDPRCATE